MGGRQPGGAGESLTMLDGCRSDEAKRRCAGVLRTRHRGEGRIARLAIDKARAFILDGCHIR